MLSIYWVLAGTGFIFAMTCLGAAMVFLFRKSTKPVFQTIFLGFAAGVMIAASVFGLLLPAIESAGKSGMIEWLPAAVGFAAGVLFLLGLDKIIPHLHPSLNLLEGPHSSMKRTTLLVFAVTLHNIPEGMAVGLSFALAAQNPADTSLYFAAVALALGIGIQNFPEGAAVALPLRQEGMKSRKAFGMGVLSGAVEPLFGILMVAIASLIEPIMPYMLSFAAGAMLYVVVEELIPEAHLGEHSNIGTISVMVGFLIMMILDVALG
ncbi:MAG: ZIP family metal transporter [Bacteroidales bacterium]|jgi:ZIP family zinc transporter|nr:ZIP family metal transporter [Bacteroidales bacterium]